MSIICYTYLALIKLVFLILFTTYAQADDYNIEPKPLYEFGIGGGGGYLPDYPGSDQSQWRGLPFPYFIYRGAIFRSDQRRGTRARFISAKSYELALSGSGSFPAHSDENTARSGMPNLDWMGEVGPRLILELSDSDYNWHTFLNLPLRMVFSSDFKAVHHRGYSLTPSIVTERFGLFHKDSRLAFELTFNFLDQELAKYFYDVAPEFVRAGRPEYSAKSGYLGTDLQSRFLHPLSDHLRTFTGLGVSYYGGSANAESPLFKSQWNYDVSIGLIWVFSKSKEKVVDD